MLQCEYTYTFRSRSFMPVIQLAIITTIITKTAGRFSASADCGSPQFDGGNHRGWMSPEVPWAPS